MKLGNNSDMPSATIADQGSLLWGSFLELSFFGIIIAHARVMILLALTTLLPNLNVDNSATMLSSSAATYPAAHIIWERPHRKPPDKSAEQYWLRKPPNINILQCRPRKPPDKLTEQHRILGELCELLSFLLRHNWFGTHALGEPVIYTILQLLSSDVPLQACGGV